MNYANLLEAANAAFVWQEHMGKIIGTALLSMVPTYEGRYALVTGAAMERLVDSVNFDSEDSINFFHRSLRRLGVIDALREKGAKEGDTVVIGEMEFDFVE